MALAKLDVDEQLRRWLYSVDAYSKRVHMQAAQMERLAASARGDADRVREGVTVIQRLALALTEEGDDG